MGMFDKLKTDGHEEQKDRLGGGYSALETDIYTGKILAAYGGKSSGGALNVTLVFEHPTGKYNETIYVSNKKGENFFMSDDKKVSLPGFTTINNICLILTGKPLDEQEMEDKVFLVWDKEASKELPKSLPALVNIMGEEISFAISKSLENKNKLEGDVYVPTEETRDVNNIEHVFHTESRMTVTEATNGVETAEFWDKWLDKNKGVTKDKTKKVGGVAGKPGGAPHSAAGASVAPRKSLFNKG